MVVKIDQLSAEDKQKALLLASKELAKREKRKWIDPDNPDSKPTPQQLEVLQDFGTVRQQWLVAGNRSGKTMISARLLSWVLEESHPYWKRPERWGDKPILIIFAGKTSKIIEEEIQYQIIHPGATQEEVAEYLKSRQDEFMAKYNN
jgi:hypothetical protein